MTARRLPAHIEAALTGNHADSAGRPWSGRDLSGPGNPLHAFDADGGAQPPSYTAAVRRLRDGTGGEADVVAALADVRVFVPVVAQLAAPADGVEGSVADKEADLALVRVTAPDGRTALPVFSSTAALAAWHPEARPVAVFAPRAALSAVADTAELLVVDPGADFTFVVRRPAVWALAEQKPWRPSYADPEIALLVTSLTGPEESITRIAMGPGSGVPVRGADGKLAAGGGAGPELRLEVELRAGLPQDAVRAVIERLQERLRSHREFVERVDSLEVKITG